MFMSDIGPYARHTRNSRSRTRRINELELSLATVNRQKDDLESELQDVKAKFKHETASMAERLKTVERQLYRAQRHIRFFDPMTCFQHEIRSGSDYESIRRCKNYTPSLDCSRVIQLVKGLNSAIHQFANGFVSRDRDHVFSENPSIGENEWAEALLRKPILAILQGQANHWQSFDLLLEVVLRIFLVVWCSNIIEGSYPKRLTFLDLLTTLNEPQADLRKFSLSSRAMGKIITKSVGVDYHAWIKDILGELPPLLEMGGIEMDLEGLSDQLLPILQKAYKIRTALAENDIYGNVEVSLAAIGAPFQSSYMDARYKTYDVRRNIHWENALRGDQVIGNISLGLEVNENQARHEGSTTTRVILKPKVVLSDNIDFGPSKPTYSLIQISPIFISG